MKNSVESISDFEQAVAKHIAIGEIVKPEFVELKRRIDRQVEKDGDAIFDKHCVGTGRLLSDLGLDDLSYGIPRNIHGIGAFTKKVDRINSDHPLAIDCKDFCIKYKNLHEQMKLLKEKVVTTTQKRTEKKEVETQVKMKKFTDASSLVEVLMEHLEEFKAHAGEKAGKNYDHLMSRLEEHEWDIDKAAPRPSSMDRRDRYRYAQAYRQTLMSLTDGTGNIRSPSAAKKGAYVDSAITAAHEDYMVWVHKMIDKIGKPVVSATMSGNPWVNSTLKVETNDGESQAWSTKMIINYSKYDLAFNQFPTRRLDCHEKEAKPSSPRPKF